VEEREEQVLALEREIVCLRQTQEAAHFEVKALAMEVHELAGGCLAQWQTMSTTQEILKEAIKHMIETKKGKNSVDSNTSKIVYITAKLKEQERQLSAKD
jgi:hypothetical protein